MMPFAAGTITVLGKDVEAYTFKEFARKSGYPDPVAFITGRFDGTGPGGYGQFPYRGYGEAAARKMTPVLPGRCRKQPWKI
jgi:hypothetical protein